MTSISPSSPLPLSAPRLIFRRRPPRPPVLPFPHLNSKSRGHARHRVISCSAPSSLRQISKSGRACDHPVRSPRDGTMFPIPILRYHLRPDPRIRMRQSPKLGNRLPQQPCRQTNVRTRPARNGRTDEREFAAAEEITLKRRPQKSGGYLSYSH